jgi:hypothetical protein
MPELIWRPSDLPAEVRDDQHRRATPPGTDSARQPARRWRLPGQGGAALEFTADNSHVLVYTGNIAYTTASSKAPLPSG